MWGREPIPNGASAGDVWADHAVAVDRFGNAFYTGWFWGTWLCFGSDTLRLRYNASDAFLAKYDINGNLLWVKQSGDIDPNNSSSVISASVALDRAGNTYITGSFSDSVSFGLFKLGGPSNSYMYLVKYDMNGNVVWAKQKYSAVGGTSVAVDASANVYVTTDDSLVKYNTFGNLIWSKNSSNANSIALDDSANIYVTGVNAYLSKYDSSGNLLWNKQPLFSSPSYCTANSVAVDGSMNAYITGYFVDKVSFASYILTGDPVSGGRLTIFLVKYDTHGNVCWAKQSYESDSSNWSGYSITCDTLKSGGGNILINHEWNQISFSLPYKLIFLNDTMKWPTYHHKGDTIPDTVVGYYQSADALIHFDSSGKITCKTLFSEGNEDDMDGIGVDPSGKYLYLGGDIYDTTAFGPDTLVYEYDMPFIARWQPCNEQIPEIINKTEIKSTEVELYPNPNPGNFTLSLQGVSEKAQITIYNILGEQVEHAPLNATTTQIKMGNKTEGLYLYRVITEKGNLIGEGKFVIEK